MDDWEENEMDSSLILLEDSGTLLSSLKRNKKTEKEVLEDEYVYEGEGDSPFDKLYNLITKKRRYINYDLVQKHFGYQDLWKRLESLDGTKITYRNGVKVSLIKSGLRDLKNETKQMSENEIKSAKPEIVMNLAEKILELIIKTKKDKNLKY